MKRLLLILILIAIGVYMYYRIYPPENHENIKNINAKNNKHVRFASHDQVYEQTNQKIEQYDEVDKLSDKSFNNTNLINTDSFIDDIFIKPIEISNTNLTLSENEYFNN